MSGIPFSRLSVVGGGLSGCVLALTALERGYSVRVVDRGNEHGSSRVAAGVINPVTGMRFLRSWRVDEFLPVAVGFYRSYESQGGRKLWNPLPLCRLFPSSEWRDRFFRRESLDGLFPYAVRRIEAGEVVGPVDNPYGGVWIEGGGWVDLPAFLDTAREVISRRAVWEDREVDIQEWAAGGDENEWLIDCRGYEPDPETWPEMPWKPAHGEILTMTAEGSLPGRILNRSQFILPLDGKKFRYGATYAWDAGLVESRGVSGEGRQTLLKSFSEWVKLGGARVLNQQAGVRPILRDQKPVLGKHPRIPRLVLFNGMGSKGGLWAPSLAGHLLDALEGKVDLDPEVDVRRFY